MIDVYILLGAQIFTIIYLQPVDRKYRLNE